MTFSFYAPPISGDYAGGLSSNIGSLLSGMNEGVQQQYLRQLQQAQIKQALANTNYLGEETKGKNIENQYLPQKLKAETAASQANADKAHLIQMIQEQMLGGGGGAMQDVGQSNTNISQPTSQGAANLSPYISRAAQNQSSGNEQKYALSPEQIERLRHAMPPPKGSQQTQITNQPFATEQQTTPSISGMNYPKAAVMMQVAGMGKPQIVEANGKFMAITPFGNFDTGANGLNSEQKAYQSGKGKYGADFYGKSVDAYQGYSNQGVALQALADAAENNPEFKNVTGPIGKPLTYWLGTPEQQQLLGTLQSSSGEIALQVAPALKGAFTGRDQSLINSIKATPEDPANVFIGKLRAQTIINNVLKQRAKLQAEMTDSGMSPIKAAEIAASATPLSNYKSAVEKLIKPSDKSSTASTLDITPEDARAELARRKASRGE